MAKVLSHTPPWLSRPSPGFDFFQPGPQTKAPIALGNGQGRKVEHSGPCRPIAHRGTEIFVVVGNEIRWSDLVLLRDQAKDQPKDQASADESGSYNYRILKTPVAGQIRQLLVSPLGDYLAILTSHTVHLAILPDPSHLSSQDTAPLRIKTFQLGPTAHVLEQASVVSALWHPLGHLGACLVTVTTDACVRLWELNRDARHSFDEPALALDLKKLANASSADEDFRASKYGTSKGFSPDSVEMEVAAACFGGAGSADEHGWSPMTLWIAMTEGDVYALCPLLPSKWEPTPSTIPSLSTSVVSKTTMIAHDPSASDDDRRIADQQQRWLADIDAQDPLTVSHPHTFRSFDVYFRPTSPPAIPRLQGPFQLSPDPEFAEVTDIFAIAPRVDDDAWLQEEDDLDVFDRDGLSVGLLCLATKAGRVHVCLDLNGVEAQWLPSRRPTFRRQFDLDDSTSELIVMETVHTSEQPTHVWPTFSKDPTNRYGFLLNLDTELFSFSLNSWIPNLEDELADPTESGAALRLNTILESAKTVVDRIMNCQGDQFAQAASLPACISIVDSDLGWFVLTSASNQPQAVRLDLPVDTDLYASFAPDDLPLALPAPEARQPYQPAEAFYANSSLPAFLDSVTQSANSRLKKTDLKTQVRFSPATLQLLTDAHRVLSTETSRLGAAAADLFRRCERMKLELTEQIRKVDEIAKRIESVTGEDDDGADVENGEKAVGKEKIEERIGAAHTRSEQLQKRIEALRRKMAGIGGKELSAREEAWAEEVVSLQQSIGESSDGPGGASETPGASLTARLQAVAQLQKELVARARDATQKEDGQPEEGQSPGASSAQVPVDFRKQKIQQVMQLLERESALVDAVTERLGRLRGIGS